MVLEGHDKRQRSGQMAGIPFGFEYIDNMSDGAQAGDTIAVVGRPSVGKSYIMFKMILTAYAAGYMPLVISMEMSAVQCARRLLALYSSVPANSIRFGKLSHWGRQKLLAGINRLPSDFIFPIIQGSLDITIDSIEAKIRDARPAAVYIDGAYLIRTKAYIKARWDRVAEVAEIMKKYAGKYDIPIFASYQFNKQGAGSLANIGGSDAIGQLASIVFSIDEEKAMSDAARRGIFYKTLELIKGREGEKGKILLLYNMIQMLIEQHSVVEDFSVGDVS
jgi:replicative DNA helicase